MSRIWILLAITVIDLTPNQCTENWPSLIDGRDPRIQRVLEGRDVVLRCAGRVENTIAHWEYKPCGGVHSEMSCSDAIKEIRRDGVGQAWTPLDAVDSHLKLRSVTPNHAGLYRCRERASNLIDLNSATQLEVLPHQTEEDTDKPQFVDGLPENLTVYKDMQAVFQCKVLSRTPPRIMWVALKVDVGAGNLQYLENWYDPFQSAGEVTLEGNIHLSKMILPRTRTEDAGRYFCVALNTKGFTYKSAYLEVLRGTETWSLYSLFFIPLGLAFVPVMLWIWYLCRVRRRHKKNMRNDADTGHHDLMSEISHEREKPIENQAVTSTIIDDLHKSTTKNGFYLEINLINRI